MTVLGGRHGAERRPRSRLVRPGVLVASVAGIATLALVAAAVRPQWQVSYHPFGGATQAPPTVPPRAQPTALPSLNTAPPPSDDGRLTGWLVLIAVGVAVALLLLAVFLWWRSGRRQLASRRVDVATEPETLAPLPALRHGVAEAERRLLGETDPTNAIINAWLALEKAAATSGIRRRPSQTPTEFTLSVIADSGVDAPPVHELLRLYHRARFSVVGSPPEDLAAARRCISELAAGWHFFTLDSEQVRRPSNLENGDAGSHGRRDTGSDAGGRR